MSERTPYSAEELIPHARLLPMIADETHAEIETYCDERAATMMLMTQAKLSKHEALVKNIGWAVFESKPIRTALQQSSLPPVYEGLPPSTLVRITTNEAVRSSDGDILYFYTRDCVVDSYGEARYHCSAVQAEPPAVEGVDDSSAAFFRVKDNGQLIMLPGLVAEKVPMLSAGEASDAIYPFGFVTNLGDRLHALDQFNNMLDTILFDEPTYVQANRSKS